MNKIQLKIKTALLAVTILVGINACTEIEPANINFDAVEASGLESDGLQSFQINLSKSVTSEVTLEFEFTGSAVHNEDYTYNTSTVVVAAGQSTADVNFRLLDNDNYEPSTDKTIIITLANISGEGVNDVSFGELTVYTYTITEDDMQIELTWNDANYDMRLLLMQEENIIRESPANFATSKTLMIYGTDSNGDYQTQSLMWRGSLDENSSVPYSIVLKFPDGSTETHSDNLILDRFLNIRHLWEIVKSGGAYSAVKDPLGTDG